jgi:glycosyltransferase involved in cell wall biosynthesis
MNSDQTVELQILFQKFHQNQTKRSFYAQKILAILEEFPQLKKVYPSPDKICTIDLMGVYGSHVKKVLGNNSEGRTDLGGQITFETGLAQGLSLLLASPKSNYQVEIISQKAPFQKDFEYPYKEIFRDFFDPKTEKLSLGFEPINQVQTFAVKITRLTLQKNQSHHFDKQEVRNSQNLFYKFLPKVASKIVKSWVSQKKIPFLVRLPYSYGGYLSQFLKVEMQKQGIKQDLVVFVGQSHSLGLPKAMHEINQKLGHQKTLSFEQTKQIITTIIDDTKTCFGLRLASERLLEISMVSSEIEKKDHQKGFYGWKTASLPEFQKVLVQSPGIQNHIFYDRQNTPPLSRNPDIEQIIPQTRDFLEATLGKFGNPSKPVLYQMGRFDSQSEVDRKGWLCLLKAFCSQDYLNQNFNLILFQDILNTQKFVDKFEGGLTLAHKIRDFYGQNITKLKDKVVFLERPDQFKMAAIAQVMGEKNQNNDFICVGASLWEPWGLTALENSACGVTIALSNKYNASKVFQANQSIYLFDPKNPIDLAKAIKKTYRDKDLKLKQKKVVQDYNWIETAQNHKLTQEFVQKPLKIQSKLQPKPPQIYFDGNQKRQVTKINNLVKAYFYWEFRDKLWPNQNTWGKYQNWLKEAKKLKIRDQVFLQNPKLGESELGFYEDSELLKCLNLQKPIKINKKESRLILFLDKDNTAIKKTDGKSNHSASLKLAQIAQQKHIPIWVISGDSFEAVEADFRENPIKLAAASCNVGVSNFLYTQAQKPKQDWEYLYQIKNFDKSLLLSKITPLFDKFKVYRLRYQNSDHQKSFVQPFKYMANLLFDIPHTELASKSKIINKIQLEVAKVLKSLDFLVKTNLCQEFGHNSNQNRDTDRYCLDLVARNKADCVYREKEITDRFLEGKQIFRIAAGDSGNDISLATCKLVDFFILVGTKNNSELYQELQKEYSFEPLYKNLYTAKSLKSTKKPSKIIFLEDPKSDQIGPESVAKALQEFLEYCSKF